MLTDSGETSRQGAEQMGSGYILDIELTGFSFSLDVGVLGKEH